MAKKEKILTSWGEDARDCAATPQYIVDAVGRPSLDVCATRATSKAPVWFSLAEGQDGLTESWRGYGDLVWCNPPYSQIQAWVEKAIYEAKGGAVIAMLLPVRSDRKWWKLLCDNAQHLDFYQGRIQFEPYNGVVFSSNREYSVLAGFGPPPYDGCLCYTRSAETGLLL